METLLRYAAVAVGGAFGAMLRYYLNGSLLARVCAPFPTATFVINITGSFLLGLFLTLATERIEVSPHLRIAFAAGFVGAYTTFSTFMYETAQLTEAGDYTRALANVVLSCVIGFAGVWLGAIAARKLVRAPSSIHLSADAMRGAELGEGLVLLDDVEIVKYVHPDDAPPQG
jgi:fluoride exporter